MYMISISFKLSTLLVAYVIWWQTHGAKSSCNVDLHNKRIVGGIGPSAVQVNICHWHEANHCRCIHIHWSPPAALCRPSPRVVVCYCHLRESFSSLHPPSGGRDLFFLLSPPAAATCFCSHSKTPTRIISKYLQYAYWP